MAKVTTRLRVWNRERTDCEIYLPGSEIDGEALQRAIEQGFDPGTDQKAVSPPSNKARARAPENK